ncbi:MAG: hypothetical protein JSW47_07810 [Phycisphaerales bacterium]|nr:MAG: hypothetical protein JSW47_07810 [Phycisphaerales bacterium]
MIGKCTARLCILVLLIGIGGCRKHTSGGRSFSFNFDSEKEEAITTAAKMYDSLCDELESRAFKEQKTTGNSEMKSTHYEGQYEGFSVKIEINHLLSVSKEKPEFSYRVSFEDTTAVDELDKVAKDFRVLMESWSDYNK